MALGQIVMKDCVNMGETTLETSGEDEKLHSKRVEKMKNYTRNEWRRLRSDGGAT
jgi:hypothetical protein